MLTQKIAWNGKVYTLEEFAAEHELSVAAVKYRIQQCATEDVIHLPTSEYRRVRSLMRRNRPFRAVESERRPKSLAEFQRENGWHY